MLYRDDATHTRDSVGLFRCGGYVEKNTRGCAVPVVADCPKAIGSGFAETGSFFARTRSSWSILRCACETGRLGCVIQKLFHNPQGWPSCLISKARFRPWEFEWKGLISSTDSAWGTALLEFERGRRDAARQSFVVMQLTSRQERIRGRQTHRPIPILGSQEWLAPQPMP